FPNSELCERATAPPNSSNAATASKSRGCRSIPIVTPGRNAPRRPVIPNGSRRRPLDTTARPFIAPMHERPRWNCQLWAITKENGRCSRKGRLPRWWDKRLTNERGAMTGPELLKPLFQFLDELIRDYGDILYVRLVYASPLLIAWALSGGFRRMQSRRAFAATTPIIVIRPPVKPSPLPASITGPESKPKDDESTDSFPA